MLMRIILVFPLFLNGAALNPKYERAISYIPITPSEEGSLQTNYTDPKPLGFDRAVLPYHGNINNVVYNRVIEIKDLTATYIEVKAETQVAGVRICFNDNATSNGGPACGSGKVEGCFNSASSTIRIEFYCDESCDSNDVKFFYRIVKSESDANDLWCTNRGDSGWPSDLITGPAVLPTGKTTPPKQEQNGNGSTIQSSVFLLFISVILFLYNVKI